MKNNRLSKIAREVYFQGVGNIKWNEVEIKYNLSKAELYYVISIIRNYNRK